MSTETAEGDTVEDWVRGWIGTYVENEGVVEEVTATVRANLKAVGLGSTRLSSPVRSALEQQFGTEGHRSAADVAREMLSEKLPDPVASEAAVPFANVLLNHNGETEWGVDVEEKLPKLLCQGVETALNEAAPEIPFHELKVAHSRGGQKGVRDLLMRYAEAE